MSARLFFLPYSSATVNGIAQPGAKLFFYQTGTLTKLPVYTTSLLTVTQSNPVIASGAGRFADIYLDSTQTYRLVVQDKTGATLDDIDPYIPGTVIGLSVDPGYQVTPQLFGAVGDGLTDDSAAFLSAIAYLKALGVNKDVYYQGSTRLFVPAGTYNMGTTTLDITHTLIIEGEGSVNGYGTRLKWSGDATGIRIQAYNTSGASTVIAGGFNSGSYTILRNLGLAGPYFNSTDFTGHTEGEYHGIHARSNYIIEDCDIDGFAGDGVYAETSSGGGGALEGSSNCSFITRLKVTNVRNGLFVDGADANAGTFTGIVGLYCRRWTVWDSSFLGNTHIGHHSANAGLVPGVDPCISVRCGFRYAVISGQETGASTNAPPSATATMTIASPGVVTWTAHGLSNGDVVSFSTTGALPTGVVAGTVYYVINSTTNTFQIAATSGGVAINTSGSQSGVHTAAAGVDNAWWKYIGPGAVASSLNVAAWTNGTTYRAGGCYHTDSANAYNTFVGCYNEGGEGPAQFLLPTCIVGGLWGTRNPITTGNWYAGHRCEINNILRLVPQNDPSPIENGMLWTVGTGDKIKARLAGATVEMASTVSALTPASVASTGALSGTTGAFSTSATIGGGTALTKAVVYSPSITPSSVGAATVAEQTFTVSGLTTADKVIVNPPAIANSTGIAGARVSAADTLAIRFVNPTAGSLTPTSGTYTVLAFRS